MRTKIFFFLFTVILLMQCSESEYLSEHEYIFGEWNVTRLETFIANNQEHKPSELFEYTGEFKKNRSLILTPDTNHIIWFWNIIENDTKMEITSKNSNSISLQEVNFSTDIYEIHHLSSDSIFIKYMSKFSPNANFIVTTKEWIFTR